VVSSTPEALILVRRRHDLETVLRNHEMPLRVEFDRREGTILHPLDRPHPASPVPGCEWQRRLGDFFFERQAFRQAYGAYRAALAGEPGCLDRAALRAVRLAVGGLQGQFGGPADEVDSLAELADPASRTRRGFALLRLGRVLDGLADFESALVGAPTLPEALLGRAVALEALERRGDAVAAYRAFLAAVPPEHPQAATARTQLQELEARQRAAPPAPR
jgi:tetratricopeptide (TPR) repeat protein